MPNFFGHSCYDTVFVVINDSQLGMEGMEIGHVLLFFSFEYWCKNFLCALINWFVHTDGLDLDTQMWIMRQEFNCHGEPTLEVIHLNSIAWAAHLLPVLLHLDRDVRSNVKLGHYWEHGTKGSSGGSGF